MTRSELIEEINKYAERDILSAYNDWQKSVFSKEIDSFLATADKEIIKDFLSALKLQEENDSQNATRDKHSAILDDLSIKESKHSKDIDKDNNSSKPDYNSHINVIKEPELTDERSSWTKHMRLKYDDKVVDIYKYKGESDGDIEIDTDPDNVSKLTDYEFDEVYDYISGYNW